MKTERSHNMISCASLMLSVVCLIGLVHVEYKLYGQQNIKCPETRHDEAAMNRLKELDKNRQKESTEDSQLQG